ncbi:MAG TPA: carbohydrate kinase family protein [Acidobacteriaceae bacterium]|jgi:sugar/nucleoside kinase (ribokinase family)|nr:carbohydrate kinase family protein [Acidobacteriaceae bacterium]
MATFDVTIAGELNLDLILYGLPEQMAVNRELLADDFRLTLGSSSAIVAHNLAALGVRVGFITRVGRDALGEIALTRLREMGVDLSRVVVASDAEQTGVTMLLVHDGSRHILTYPGQAAKLSAADLSVAYLMDSRHFHLSSLYLQSGMHRELPALCRRLKEAGLTLSLDTNDDPEDRWGEPLEELLEVVDIVLPNEDEALRMTGTKRREDAARALAERVPLVAIKCGRDGCLIQRGEERWFVTVQAVQPVDTIGAGDSFNAGFLRGFLEGRSPAACGAMGNAAAAFSTLRPGGTEAYRDRALVESELLPRLPAESL